MHDISTVAKLSCFPAIKHPTTKDSVFATSQLTPLMLFKAITDTFYTTTSGK